jgi:hypothetical protein
MNESPQRNATPKKITIKIAKKRLNESPLKNRRRRKSSIPVKSMESLNNHSISKISKIQNSESFSKKSHKGENVKNKIFLKEMVSNSIPEVSENSSNNEKEEKNSKNNKKQENNKYYIHYVKSVYEKESHFKKENKIKNANKNIHESFIKFLQSSQNNVRNSFKRRNSALNSNFFKSNIHNINVILNNDHMNQKVPGSIINKKKNEERENLLHKKNIDNKQKEIVKIYINKKKLTHIKQKEKEKENEKNEKDVAAMEDKISNKDKTTKSNDKTAKEIVENEKKTEIENNTENSKNKKNKNKNKFKKFLCCILNSNADSSIEND